MILSEAREVPLGSKTGRSRRVLTLKCDQCFISFTSHKNIKSLRSKANHYCTQRCFALAFRRDGIADLKRRKTNNERYGTDYVISRPDIAKELASRAHTDASHQKRLQTIKIVTASKRSLISHG